MHPVRASYAYYSQRPYLRMREVGTYSLPDYRTRHGKRRLRKKGHQKSHTTCMTCRPSKKASDGCMRNVATLQSQPRLKPSGKVIMQGGHYCQSKMCTRTTPKLTKHQWVVSINRGQMSGQRDESGSPYPRRQKKNLSALWARRRKMSA